MPHKDPEARRAYHREYREKHRADRVANMPAERAAARARYAADPDKNRAKHKTWAQENPEKVREATRAWRRSNPERVLEAQRSWASKNAAYVAEKARGWQIANPEKNRAAAQRTRAKRLTRNAQWDVEVTELVLVEAADAARRRAECTGFAWEVDHTIPLQGKKVSGLHVWNNLRVIPKFVNRSKGNNFEVCV